MRGHFKKRTICLVLASLLSFSTTTIAQDSAIVVFDGSGSMNKKVDGKPKFEIAQEVMGDLVKDWNEDIKLGLMVYGHRSKSCDDIEMVIPVGTANPKQFTDAIKQINPKGETPIAESLKQAAEKLNYIESPTTVILISDGEESCNADPCAMAKELEKKGINFTAHVIGFDVSSEKQAKALEQLKCVAKSTGGKFFEAKDSEALKTALAETAEVIAMPTKKKAKKLIERKVVNWKDDFNREELGEDYEIEKFNEDGVAISDGKLLIITTNPSTNNIFFKENISGNFEASVKVTMNLTNKNWAGIVYKTTKNKQVYLGLNVNTSDGAYIVGSTYDRNNRSVFFQKIIKEKKTNSAYYKKIGKRTVDISYAKIGGEQPQQDWYFKIVKKGFKLIGYASIDRKKWTKIGEHALLQKEGQIGLRVGGKGKEDPILFDDLRIKPIK
ncbi:vWA domain-containing protein [Lutibacter sp.]